MVKIFETIAQGGVIRLPDDAPSSAHCVVTILEDVQTLRAQAALTIPEAKQQRMSELLLKNREGTLDEGEIDELDALSQEFDVATLSKGRALATLAHIDGHSQDG